MDGGSETVMRVVGSLTLLLVLTACHPWTRVAPSSATPWTPPEPLAAYLPAAEDARAPTGVVPDPERIYDLVDLVDLAERNNPETRRAWEQARAAAARLGMAVGAYLPTLAVASTGGWGREVNSTADGTEIIRGTSITPRMDLTWRLLDFGRRASAVDRARQELLAANFSVTRAHQDVAFAVERSFYLYAASRARVRAAEATLASAVALREAAEARLRAGLATVPESLLARQEEARAGYELQAARGDVDTTYATLAAHLGVAPTARLRTADLGAQQLPAGLADSVERVIAQAIGGRPDLAARLAALRAREAQVRAARAQFWPTVGVTGNVGGAFNDYRAGPPFASHHDDEPVYGGFLGVEWTLFEGWQRENAVRAAGSEAESARAEVVALELSVLREVWKAYADVKTSLRKYDFASALLRASEDAYEASLATYRAGVGDFLDLLAAERELARARFTHIESRADVLTASAALTHAAGTTPGWSLVP
jgi:outer membrane protein TolC